MSTNRGSVRFATIVLVAAAAALAGTGCDTLGTTYSDDYSEQAAITEVRIDGGSGNVTVRPGGAGTVEINRKLQTSEDRPGPTHRIEGAVLHLSTRCGAMCSVSYEVTAPGEVKVTGRNGSGNLTVTGVSAVDFTLGSGEIKITDATGPVQIQNGSGDIELVDVTGTVTAKTRSGSVKGRGLSSDEVTAETSSGNVDLALGRPADVRASTGSGNVVVAVPDGRYRVETDSGTGDVSVDIPRDPAGEHLLSLRTGSGDITVRRA